MDTSQNAAATIVDSLAPELRDKLFPLMRDGPGVVQELTGNRPHKSVLYRQARDRQRAVRLETVTVGRTMYCTRRLLIEFWAKVDAARRAATEPEPAPPPRRRTTRRKMRVRA